MRSKFTGIVVFAMLSFMLTGLSFFTIGTAFALKDEDKVDVVVTVENIEKRDVEIIVYISDKEKDKTLPGNPSDIVAPTTAKYVFTFDRDDFNPAIGIGTEVITCIEFDNGKGEPSCITDKFKSDTQPLKVTLDTKYIRD